MLTKTQYIDFTTKPGFATLWDAPHVGAAPVQFEVTKTGERKMIVRLLPAQ
jgi:hypothetical protein